MTDKKEYVLIVDGMNFFIRSYIANPTMNPGGEFIGGIVGFLQSLQKTIRLIGVHRIKSVFICWDGPEGSRKRKSYNKDYKANRGMFRLNRPILKLDDQEELKNRTFQQQRLVEYLSHLPVTQLMFEFCEADDLISYICSHELLQNEYKIIVSSDTDFFQLCDERTIVFQPTKEKIISQKYLLEEYGISARNFALARAIAGDHSDNLKGVGNVGLKTIHKRFPIFAGTEKSLTIDEVVKFCVEQQSELKAFSNIVAEQETIKKNYRLMSLIPPMISLPTKEKIDQELSNIELTWDDNEFRKCLTSDGLLSYPWPDLIALSRKFTGK